MFNVILLGIASFFADLSGEMIYPLLPLYLTSARIGASPAIVGIVEGIAETTGSLLRVFSGYFSDHFQSRKPITIFGYSAAAVGKLLLYLSASWFGVLVGRVVDRFGKGVRGAPRDALIADSVEPARRGAAFGLHRALDTFGAVGGVTIAYILFVGFKDDFQPIFLVSVIPATVAVFVLLFVRERKQTFSVPAGGGRGGQGERKQPWWRNLRAQWGTMDRRLKVFFVIVFVFNLGNSSNQFLLLRAKSLGYSDATAILLYLAYNVVYAFGSYPAGRLSDRIGRKTLLVAGYGIYGMLYLAFAIAAANWLFVLFGLYGIYSAITDGIEKALVSDLAPVESRATMIGLHATFTGIGLLPASILAGFLWDTIGPAAPFFFGGAMGIAAAVALWRLI